MLSIRFFWKGSKIKKIYNIVIMHHFKYRNSKFKEKIGTLILKKNKFNFKYFFLNKKRLYYWLTKGAIPTENVYNYLKKFNILY